MVERETGVGDSGVTRQGPSVSVPALAALMTEPFRDVDDEIILVNEMI